MTLLSGWLFKLGQLLVGSLVLPLLQKFGMWMAEQWQERRKEAERNAELDAILKRYKEAKDAAEQEAAFRDLVRSKPS